MIRKPPTSKCSFPFTNLLSHSSPSLPFVFTLSILTIILPYFSWLHDINLLLSLLSKPHRKQWLKSKSSICSGIFRSFKSYWNLGLLDEEKLKQLFKGQKYLLYRFEIRINKSSYRWLMRLCIAQRGIMDFETVIFENVFDDSDGDLDRRIETYNYYVQKFMF